jgi:hypothetical protein
LFAFYLATFDPPAVSSDNLHQGGGEMSCNWVINVATLSDNTNSYVLRLGLAFKDSDDPDEKSEFSDGFYFTYTHSVNSGNWTINTADAGVRTSTNSGQAVATGWVNLGVVINAAGTSAEYFIDDVSVGTITTNFPTHGFSPAFQMAQTGGEIPEGSVQPDLMYMTYTLTNPR